MSNHSESALKWNSRFKCSITQVSVNQKWQHPSCRDGSNSSAALLTKPALVGEGLMVSAAECASDKHS